MGFEQVGKARVLPAVRFLGGRGSRPTDHRGALHVTSATTCSSMAGAVGAAFGVPIRALLSRGTCRQPGIEALLRPREHGEGTRARVQALAESPFADSCRADLLSLGMSSSEEEVRDGLRKEALPSHTERLE